MQPRWSPAPSPHFPRCPSGRSPPPPTKKLWQWVLGCRAHCKHEKWRHINIFFPEWQARVKAYSKDRWRYRGEVPELCQLPLLGRQSHKGTSRPLPPQSMPTHCSCTAGRVWSQGTVVEFYGLWTPSPTTFPQRGVLWGKGDQVREEKHIYPEIQDIFHHSTETWEARLKKWNKTKTRTTTKKPFVFQRHLLENKRKTSFYQTAREVSLLDSWTEKESIKYHK